MTIAADDLRRFADVVDALQNTPVDIDGAQLLEANEDAIRGRVTLTVPDDAELDTLAMPTEERGADADDDREKDAEEMLDHTSTADLQRAYDEADGNISAASDRFEVGYGAVYRRMVKHGVHETESDETGESGTSIEDDTPDSKSTSESEARDVDLEEDGADDAPAGTGDDVQDEPTDNHDAETITVDAVDDQDEIDVELPEGVTQGDVEAAVDEHETLGEVAKTIGVTRGRARTITVAFGCYSDVRDVPPRGEKA
ncbi:hypothetical protein [Halosolutus halophilus]|uniref:hypothetical protein n=1 Tax=Halosolutus halophilus TaxID=1552990 RepID=UPI002234F040|nr:hypothetical protein [Halosolutus halophilus]